MEQKNHETTLDLSVFWHNFTRTLPHLIWLPLVLALALGGWQFYRSYRSYSPRYTARAVYIVNSNYSGTTDITSYGIYYDSGAATRLASTFPYVLTTDLTKQLLMEKTGRSSLPASISADCVAESNLLTITATGGNAQAVYDTLKTVVEIYPQAAANILGSITLKPLEEVELPTEPNEPFRPVPGTVKYALYGLLLGLGIIALLAYLRKTVHNTDDLKKILNTPCLGMLPRVHFKSRSSGKKTVLLSNPHLSESYVEAMRTVRFQLKKELENQDAKVIMVTSTSPEEGKTTVSANLALSLAEQGHQVILVDADLRKQSLKDLFEISGSTRGLVELISKKEEDAEPELVQIPGTSLRLLSGDKVAAQPQNFLSSPLFSRILVKLRRKAEYIIIDTPPSGILSDTATLSEWVDGLIYVVRQDYVNRSTILDSAQGLGFTGVRFIGCILNITERSTSRYGYGYGYGRGYGYGYGYGYSKRYGSYYGSSKSTAEDTPPDNDTYVK